MRLVTYVNEAGEARGGVASAARIVDLALGAAARGKRLPADIVGLLTLEAAGLALVGEVLARAASVESSCLACPWTGRNWADWSTTSAEAPRHPRRMGLPDKPGR